MVDQLPSLLWQFWCTHSDPMQWHQQQQSTATIGQWYFVKKHCSAALSFSLTASAHPPPGNTAKAAFRRRPSAKHHHRTHPSALLVERNPPVCCPLLMLLLKMRLLSISSTSVCLSNYAHWSPDGTSPSVKAAVPAGQQHQAMLPSKCSETRAHCQLTSWSWVVAVTIFSQTRAIYTVVCIAFYHELWHSCCCCSLPLSLERAVSI